MHSSIKLDCVNRDDGLNKVLNFVTNKNVFMSNRIEVKYYWIQIFYWLFVFKHTANKII